MVATIARREFIGLWRDGRLLWGGGIVVALVLTALLVGWQRREEVRAERVAAQSLDYDDWVAQPERHPHNAAHQGMHVFRPDPVLAVIDPGIDPYVGSTIWLRAHRQSELKFVPAQDATGLQRFGELSAAWVLQVLGPLLILILGFDAFAGERESGTLRQTLSLGVSPRQLLWGKALGQALALAALLAPAALIGVAVVLASSEGRAADVLTRVAWLALGYGLYFAAVIGIVLTVSALARSSRLAIVTLLGIWMATTLLAPRIASDLSRSWHPSPTRLDFDAALGAELGDAAAQAWKERLGVETQWGSDLPLDKWGLALRVDDHAGYPVMDRHFAALWDTFAEQQRAQERLGIVAPILAIRAFSMGVAGTDFAHYRSFSLAAERHRRVLQDAMSADLVEHADTRGTGHFDYQAERALWRRVPPFEYALPPVSWAVGNSLPSLLVLAGAAVLALAASHGALAFRRLV